MKAGIYEGKNKVSLQDIPIPEIGPDDVLLETICTAISREDIIAYTEGSSAIQSGSLFGHETIARVIGFGDNIYDFNLGERVFPMSCAAVGSDQACMLGAFSEFLLLHNPERNVSLFPIPDAISDRMAALLEPFSRGTHAARCAMKPRTAEELYYIIKEDAPCEGDIRYQEGERAIVFGSDAYAFAAAIMLRWYGMESVTICDNASSRLSVAGQFGLHTAAPLSADYSSYDCWIDTTGSQAILSLFAEQGRKNSRLVISPAAIVPVNAAVTGSTAALAAVDPMMLATEGKSLIGSGMYTLEDLSDAVSLMASGVFDLEQIITHDFSIDQLEEALLTAAEETSGQVLIDF